MTEHIASLPEVASALRRFRAKCVFQPETGCVIWTGGKTAGRGNSALYGSFWFQDRRWFAHRWAACFIHGLDIEGKQVGHNCPHTPDEHPNTLCVEHVVGQTQIENLAEQMARGTGIAGQWLAQQAPEERRMWLLTELGYEVPPPTHDPTTLVDEIPFFEPPKWLNWRPYHGTDPFD